MALNDEKKAAYVAEGYTGPISEAEHNFLVANPRGSWIQYITSLQDAGYSGTDEDEIVDAWFTGLCRQIAEDEG